MSYIIFCIGKENKNDYRFKDNIFNEINMKNNDFNVKNYTDIDLFNLMDLSNPTDRELEAKIYSLIEKY